MLTMAGTATTPTATARRGANVRMLLITGVHMTIFRSHTAMRRKGTIPRIFAICHPERPHKAGGVCAECYPEYCRRRYLLRKYHLTLPQYAAMVAEREGRCDICKRVPTLAVGGRGIRMADPKLVIDHDHVSGHVRGLLCQGCNTAIARLEDDPEIIARAIAYLERAAAAIAARPAPPIVVQPTQLALDEEASA
jgi:Recombination endonuclease VII